MGVGGVVSEGRAVCQGRPGGSAGSGGNVVTRPDSRDAPHLFGLGLKEMLADEMTSELRSIRDNAVAAAKRLHGTVTLSLVAKGIRFRRITAHGDDSVDTAEGEGQDPDLRVKPFFAEGSTISMRAFIVGA